MALSTYFNWDTLQIPTSAINNNFHEATQEPAHHFSYSDESFFLPNTTLIDSYFDPTGFLYPEINPLQFLPCTSSYEEPPISLNEIFGTENDNLLPRPKRHKSSYEEGFLQSSIQEVIPSNFFDGFVPNPCSLQAEDVSELFSSVQEFKVPQPHGTCLLGNVELQCEKKANERTISAQSIAARERRRKITEKTQELGKLVPGGPKMNTAEMLHAAVMYVKYLQAQVGMLQLMSKLKEDNAAPPPTEDLHSLVVSPIVQEKLYSEERCFVPKEFVTTLANHDNVQSRPIILKDLKQLIGTDIEKRAKQE